MGFPMTTSLRLAAVASMYVASAFAKPAMQDGIYSAANMGLLHLRWKGEQLTGSYIGGGPCRFEADKRVLEGQFEEDVFVGTLLLCQVGEKCSEQRYSWLGIFNSPSGTLVGEVPVSKECESPALVGKRLRVSPATIQERQAIEKFIADVPKIDGKRRRPSRQALKFFREAWSSGHSLLLSKDFSGARVQFERAIAYNPLSASAYLGLGTAELMLERPVTAIAHLKTSVSLKRMSKRELRTLHKMLAIAYAELQEEQSVKEHVAIAIRNGATMEELFSDDHALKRMFPNDDSRHELRIAARGAKANKKRR